MPGSPRTQIEAHRKRLLQPLHDRRELQPVRRTDIERQPFLRKSKPPKLEGEAPPRLAKYLAENRYRLPSPEQRFKIINRSPNLIPGVLQQKSLLSHTISIWVSPPVCFNRIGKKLKKQRKSKRRCPGKSEFPELSYK
jgi:hypothetical protein